MPKTSNLGNQIFIFENRDINNAEIDYKVNEETWRVKLLEHRVCILDVKLKSFGKESRILKQRNLCLQVRFTKVVLWDFCEINCSTNL